MSSWKPNGYTSVSPYRKSTTDSGSGQMIVEVFNGEELRRYDNPDGSVMHVEVQIDDAVVMIGGADLDDASSHVHVNVRHVGSVYEKAIGAGANPVREPRRD